MGKKKGPGRRGGTSKGPGGRGSCGSSGGVGISFGGIIDPSLLARHAAAARTTLGAPCPAPPQPASLAKKKKREEEEAAKGPKRKGDEGEGGGGSSKRRKRRKESGGTPSPASEDVKKCKKQKRGVIHDNGDAGSSDAKRHPLPSLKGGEMSDGGVGGDGRDGPHFIHSFGRPRWRRTEQLCWTLLFPVPRPDSSADGEGDDDETHDGRGGSMRIVFVSDPSCARHLAALFKPALHPLPSTAIHGRAKKDQVRSAADRALSSYVSAAGAASGPALFVSDEAIGTLVWALKEAGRRWNTLGPVKREGGGGGGGAGVLAVHLDPPLSEAALDLRVRAADAVTSAASGFVGGGSNRTHRGGRRRSVQVKLDGMRDEFCGVERPGGWGDLVNPAGDSQLISLSLRDAAPPSDRNVCQAVVNAAARMQSSDGCPERKAAARGKLMAHVAALRARLGRDAVGEKCSGPSGPSSCGSGESAAETVRKMKTLGMIADNTTTGRSSGRRGGREAALTRWLDGADGRKFGGSWKGPVRSGASAEPATKKLAALLLDLKSGMVTCHGALLCGPCGLGRAWFALRSWRPNPMNGSSSGVDDYDRSSSADGEGEDDARRDFGDLPSSKSCSHNEAAMFFLRPFASLEVQNSRVCSRSSPAPGNGGYEGCLEFLQRLCAAAGRGMTFWDSESFAYVDGQRLQSCWDRGRMAPVLRLYKRDLLHLSHDQLLWLMDALRQWTLFREGKGGVGCHPRLLVLGISLALRVAVCSKESRVHPPCYLSYVRDKKRKIKLMDFPSKVIIHIMGFALPGTAAQWVRLGAIALRDTDSTH